MLLRKIAKHVKDQNWFAVVLDFIIVVMGILIAFQITNWNDTRQSNEAEHVLIGSFITEFSSLEEVLKQRLERAEQLISNSADLIMLIRSKKEPQDHQAVKTLLMLATRYNAPVAMPTSFSDALQSGRVNSLRDKNLRIALNGYVISRDWWGVIEGPAEPQIDPNSKLTEAITWSIHQELFKALRQQVIDYNWTLVSDAEQELVAIHRKQILQAEAYRLELIEVEKVLTTLNKVY
ncbi:DUF6090 family protein [Paraglaciecola sp.]|uniref:DUF6090 family protein n=1 Tax=Paraglaciecola sp. TaxID=1920173 RepID=UPI003EF4EA0B